MECLECVTSLVTKVTQRVFCIMHPCQYCIVLDTHKGVMTSNDVKGECHITMMTGRCVNKPDQTKAVGCYENLVISKFTKCK